MKLLVNGAPADGARLGPWALHGATVFTTIRVEEGAPALLERHLARLADHARALGVDHPGDDAIVRDLHAASSAGGRLLVRLTLGDGIRLAQARPLEPPSADVYANGARAIVTARRIHPDLGRYKTGNHLPYRLAAADAAEAGAFEGLLLDPDGNVVDGSRTSPILVSGDDLVILEGGLDGITREAVAIEARALGFDVRRERRSRLDGQLLLAGSGVGLVPAGRPEDPRVRRLISAFRLDHPCSRR